MPPRRRQLLPRREYVSLSRPLAIRAGQIETFTSMLRKQTRAFKPFDCSFGDLLVLRNDEATTCFVAVALADRPKGSPEGPPGGGGSGLDVLVDRVDLVLRRHGLREYYGRGERVHHLSLVWAPGEWYAKIKGAVGSLRLGRCLSDLRSDHAVRVEAFKAKVGSTVTTFNGR